MPFNVRHKSSLPSYLQQYWAMIQVCLKRAKLQDSCAFLTIDERPVLANSTHRRGGVHIECPGYLALNDFASHTRHTSGSLSVSTFIPGIEQNWGRGIMDRDESFLSGVFMASTVADTCALSALPQWMLYVLMDVCNRSVRSLGLTRRLWLPGSLCG